MKKERHSIKAQLRFFLEQLEKQEQERQLEEKERIETEEVDERENQ